LKTVTIENREIGDGHPVYIIAEIGYNFNTVDEAKASIDAAVDCGVDALKFQTFRAETVTSRFTDFPDEAGGTNQFDEFKQYEISEELHKILFNYARKRGAAVFSTPAYYDDVDLLERLNAPVHKVGLDDLTNLPFLRYVAKTGKPLIFSTGMATLGEAAVAFEAIEESGNDQIIVLHCLSNYPIRDVRQVNLRAIRTMRRAFPSPVGFSDHTTSLTCALAAVALGANVIERHFTIDKNLDVPDAFFSSDPGEMKALVEGVREVELALGDGVKRPTDAEKQMRVETRKSTIARVDIPKGETITEEMIIVKRPGSGIAPKHAHLVPGRVTRQAIAADEVISADKLI
jgi:N-acetylneuraminate synthase